MLTNELAVTSYLRLNLRSARKEDMSLIKFFVVCVLKMYLLISVFRGLERPRLIMAVLVKLMLFERSAALRPSSSM